MSDNFSDNQKAQGMRRVNGYDLIEEIGSGGMSRVYRARRASDGEVVALKVIPIDNMAADFEARLHREPEIQQGIGHENIVRLIESFRDGDQYFLAMEYVDGRSLAQMLYQESGPLPFERARRYFRQVLRGVEHLHRLGIVHRDIKPSNILIRWDDVVKLADFGIAKFAWQQAATKTQRGLGTPEYMSPEQARGQHVDYRTDIYSLGITLFEALTARKPFAREIETPAAYGEIVQEILTRALPDPRTYNPSIPPEVVRLLHKATAKAPGERFQSAAEFLGALEIVDASGVVTSMPPRADSYRTEPSAPTMVAPAPSPRDAHSAPTMVNPGHAPPGRPPVTGAPRREPHREPEHRRSILPWVLLILLFLGVGGYFGYQWYQQRMSLTTGRVTNDDAMRVSKQIAGEMRKYQVEANAPALASLYASNDVEFFKDKDASRKEIESDLLKFLNRIVRTDRYDVDIRRARALNDSTIETEWIITYERTRDDSTLLRGSTSNTTRLELIDGEWLITRQRENWTKRNNVAPPKRIDTVVTIDTTSQGPQVHDLPQTPERTAQESVPTVRMFLSMLTSGDATQAWSTYTTSAMQASDTRQRMTIEFSGKGFEVADVGVDGEQVVAKLVRSEGGVEQVARLYISLVDEGGPKISSIRVNSR